MSLHLHIVVANNSQFRELNLIAQNELTRQQLLLFMLSTINSLTLRTQKKAQNNKNNCDVLNGFSNGYENLRTWC